MLRAFSAALPARRAPACVPVRFASFKKQLDEMKRIKPANVPSWMRGVDIFHDPQFNKGTAFPQRERDRLGLRGLLPPRELTIDDQLKRAYYGLHKSGYTTDMDKKSGRAEDVVAKYLFLISLQDRNETLFYRLLTDNLAELAPVIYTPTVGYACQHAGTLYRRNRGMYFTAEDKGDMHAIIQNWPVDDVEVIVITDGSRILGLGDLGAHGQAIPIGKLSLYVAAGGISPSRCLPVCIDVGTNNQALLDDPLYLGMKHTRITGEAYLEVIDEFMCAVRGRYPRALVQFEDFRTPNAELLLSRYRNDFRMFNDDIQGTGAVALGGILSALRAGAGDNDSRKLTDQRIVCVGAGSAGIGVCNSIAHAMVEMGLTREEAHRRFWILDNRGLLTRSRVLDTPQQPFARAEDGLDGMRLEDVVSHARPTVLLGLSGVGGVFTEGVVRAMAANVHRPIIFAMSNPTHLSECTAAQAYAWTDGRAVFASGSPFAPVEHNGRTFAPSQANNMYIFPGVGLGVTASGCRRVTDTMFFAAAETLAACLEPEDLEKGMVFPRVQNIRGVSQRIAAAVAAVGERESLTTVDEPADGWLELMRRSMWTPEYVPLVQKRVE
eukprot:Opistho-1_new@26945